MKIEMKREGDAWMAYSTDGQFPHGWYGKGRTPALARAALLACIETAVAHAQYVAAVVRADVVRQQAEGPEEPFGRSSGTNTGEPY